MNILAIDLGSVNTKAVIVSSTGKKIRILGIGRAKTRGVLKGEITNMESAGKSIKDAIDQASSMCNADYQKVVVNISSSYTTSDEQSAYFSIQKDAFGKNGISTSDISKAIETAKHRASISDDYKIIHVLPVSFKLDNQDNIEDPIGMSANGIEVKVHIVKTKMTNYQNIHHILELAGISTYELVSSAYANIIFNCGENERELGTIVIDMGGHTCDISIVNQNSLISHLSLGVGSQHISNDISITFATPTEYAEKIKIDFQELIGNYENISIPKIGVPNETIDIKTSIISDVIYARVRETLMVLLELLKKRTTKDISYLDKYTGAGIIFTGGMTKVYNFLDYATAVFHNKTVRFGTNANNCFVENEDDSFKEFIKNRENSCVLGLCMYGAGYFTNYEINSNNKFKVKSEIDNTLITSEQSIKENNFISNPTAQNTDLKDFSKQNSETIEIYPKNDNFDIEEEKNGMEVAKTPNKESLDGNLNINDIILDKNDEKSSDGFFGGLWQKIKSLILKYF